MIKYTVKGEFIINGIGKVIVVEFLKPQLRKKILELIGTEINGLEIVNVELNGTGISCDHNNAGLLIRGEWIV